MILPSKKVLFVLPLISGLAYLPLSYHLGFYADDWFTNLECHTGTYLRMQFDNGRFGTGILVTSAFKLLGDHVFLWHLFAWILVLTTGLSVYWLARSLWPDAALSIAVLAMIYPGFSGWSVSMMYPQWYIGMSLAFLSIGLSLRESILASILAVILGLMSWLTIEQFIALETVRYYLLWRQRRPRKIVPYAIVAFGFFTWRVLIFSPRQLTSTHNIVAYYWANPTTELLGFINRMGRGLLDSLAAWFIVPYRVIEMPTTHLLPLLGSIAAGVIGAFIYWKWTNNARLEGDLTVVGLLYVVSILLVPSFARLPVGLFSFGDRFLLAASLGSVLVVFGVVSRFPRAHVYLSVIVGLCIFSQLLIANSYRKQWETFRQGWWELSWRAPQLKPETLVLVDAPSLLPTESNGIWEEDIWGPLNKVYGAPKIKLDLAGQQLTPEVLKALNGLDSYEPPIDPQYYAFEVDPKKSLIIAMPDSGNCLKVISGADRIINGINHVPAAIFGAEPKHGKCFEFQKNESSKGH